MGRPQVLPMHCRDLIGRGVGLEAQVSTSEIVVMGLQGGAHLSLAVC